MINSTLRIAIDGGVATGKTTIAKQLAKVLNIKYISTGEMFRLIALYAKSNNLINNVNELLKELKTLDIYFENDRINCSWKFDYNDLFLDEISTLSSTLSSNSDIRDFTNQLQKQIAKSQGVLLEGRDIGTIIMPDADYKFFLTINSKEAAKRRYLQLSKKDKEQISLIELENNIIARNKIDQERTIAPLKKANNAIEIKTDKKTINEIIKEILTYVK